MNRIAVKLARAKPPPVKPATGDAVFHVGNGVTAPRALYQPEPDFTNEARKAKFRGVTVLTVIVDPGGRISQEEVTRPLGMGLDESAAERVKTWKFEPARKDGNPVAVQVTIEVSFNLY